MATAAGVDILWGMNGLGPDYLELLGGWDWSRPDFQPSV